MQQYLPKTQLPVFRGAANDWVDFFVKFRDVVHNQPYLSNTHKNHLLLQHLEGEAKRAVREYANVPNGYILSLKSLKYFFGQRSAVARATLLKVTKGKVVGSDDVKGLTELYYSINDCLVTLRQLNYTADLQSTDTLRQAVARLPLWLLRKWSERCLLIRRYEEPNLFHLCHWLRDRVMASKEPYLPDRAPPKRESGRKIDKNPTNWCGCTIQEVPSLQ